MSEYELLRQRINDALDTFAAEKYDGEEETPDEMCQRMVEELRSIMDITERDLIVVGIIAAR